MKPHKPAVLELLSIVQEQDIAAAVVPAVEDREGRQSAEAEKRPAKKKSHGKTRRDSMTR